MVRKAVRDSRPKTFANIHAGKAYISTNASSDLDELTCKCWHLVNGVFVDYLCSWKSLQIGPEPSMDAPWNVTMSGKVSTPGSASFYIIPSDNAFDNAGFQRANETAPDGAAMKGFFKFGSQIMFYNNGSYESKFWAQSTKVDGLYTLNWNSNNVDKEDSVPVTIKISSDS